MLINYASAIGGAILTALIAWAAHSLDVSIIEARHAREMTAKEDSLRAACEKDKQITQEASRAFQDQIAALSSRVHTLKRLRATPACVSVASPARGHNAAPGSGKPAGQDVVASSDLIDYAEVAEKYRLQLLGCQKFIQDAWATRSP